MLHDYPAAQFHRSDMMRHMVLNVLHDDVNESLGCATRSRVHLEGCERHPLTRTDARRKGGVSVTLRRTVSDRSFRRPSCRGCDGDRCVPPTWGFQVGGPSRAHGHPRQWRSRPFGHASSPPRNLAPPPLVTWHVSGSASPAAAGLLS